MSNNNITVRFVEYHRNGVGGAGFHTVVFTDYVTPEQHERDEPSIFFAVVFESSGHVAVFELDSVPDNHLWARAQFEIGGNCWNCDWWEAALRSAIDDYEARAIPSFT